MPTFGHCISYTELHFWCKYRHNSEILQEFSIFFLKKREKVAFLWAFQRFFGENVAKIFLNTPFLSLCIFMLFDFLATEVLLLPFFIVLGVIPYYIYTRAKGQNSADFGVRGKGMTSRMFCMPVTKRMSRSKPRPKPAWGQEP